MNSSHESRPDKLDDIWFRRKGNKRRGIFFGTLGVLFEIISFLVWFSLSSTDPELLFLLFTLFNSEMFPFLFIVFVFGAGCFLIALRDFGWEESIYITTDLIQNVPGIRKELRFFWWSRTTDILQTQIVTLRLHSILLDEFGINKSYLIELDYQKNAKSFIESLVLYKEPQDKTYEPALSLVNKIQDLLSLPQEFEKTESATLPRRKKKKEN
jgi:hypothetical protein